MLSQYEQHQLAAIERQLAFDDPVLALSLSRCARLPRTRALRRLLLPLLVLVLGIAAAVVGLTLLNVVAASVSLPICIAGVVWLHRRLRGGGASVR
jgi:lipopolysaccharide export LptBFGC system permease protein LptF